MNLRQGGNEIVCLHSKAGNWYGRKEKIKDYDAYIFFPGKPGLHHTKYCMCDLCVTYLTSFLSLLGEQEQNRKEKRSILQDQKRLRVINALGHAYSSISLVNIKNRENRNCKIFKEYEAGSEREYSFQSAPGRTDTAGYYRAISGEIS